MHCKGNMATGGGADLPVQPGKRIGLAMGAGSLLSTRKFAPGDLNGEKAVTCLLFSSGICGTGLVRSSGDGGTGPSPHTPRNLKTESPTPSSLALQETDKDGAGYWCMVLGFILFGNDGLVLPVSCGRD